MTRGPVLVAVLGPTATGKSRLAIALAERLGGEVVACDSTAVYRGFDVGTDKVAPEDQRGIPHHMVDLVGPDEVYSAARYARQAAAVIRGITARGRLPILAGGTGFYFRALTRGLFPGPARDERLRRRIEDLAARRGTDFVHRMLARVDSPSAARIEARDLKRLVRALEVFFLTGRPLSAHFAETASAIPGYRVVALGLRISSAETADRVARRVEDQFARGVVDEVRRHLARGLPETALPFTGLVYRQILEFLHGVRDEAGTRALIVAENRRYARRQLIWFRKEPNLLWLHGPGEHPDTLEAALNALAVQGVVDRCRT
jgi:tRNA dimethylallyltransferase